MITQALADFVAGHSADEIPEAGLDASGNALIDPLGVAIAGSVEPVADIAAAWADELGAREQAIVWAKGCRTHASEAAFANGVSAHALDFDDSHPGARGHMSAGLIPAAVAAGEAIGASGRQVLAAYAVGMEVAGAVGRLFGPGHLERGYHPTPTVGAFGVTAVAAHLSGLDVDGVARAFGLTASQIGGLGRNFGTMAKPFHSGFAARIGLVSAWMAKKGLTADPKIFDGKRGVLAIFAGGDGEPADQVLARLGKDWEVIAPGNYVKRWPCCYSGHRSLGVLYRLIDEHKIKPDDVEDVAIGFLPGGETALLAKDPKTGLEGKFSIEYMVAAALLDGPLRMATFTDDMVQRPEARAIMQKVRRLHIPDEKIYSGIGGFNEIAVTTKTGKYKVKESRVPGSPEWPMADADRDRKFVDGVGPVLGEARATAILDLARQCAELGDIRELTRAVA
jgi:2-methylcitrate dehydratase PrpD